MRVAVISDIHGNLHALEAVLEAIDADEPDALWCLGDLVGYGPQPNRCTTAVAARAELCLAGNHDLAALGELPIEEFSPDAAASAEWTRGVLTAETRAFLGRSSRRASASGVELFHGSPVDPVWDYVLSGEAARGELRGDDGADHPRRAQPRRARDPGRRRLALRRPRPGRHRARAATAAAGCSTPARSASRATATRAPRTSCSTSTRARRSFRRVEYPIARTQAEIREAGLPWRSPSASRSAPRAFRQASQVF